MSGRRRAGWPLAACAGVAATLLGVGVGELVAALLAGSSSPVLAVASALVDLAPGWAKETAIQWFGTGDKAALVAGIGVVLLLVAAAAGVLERRWRWSGTALLLLCGAGGLVAVLTRAALTQLAALPVLCASAAACVALSLLIHRALPAAPAGRAPAGPASGSRRRFLLWSAGTAAAGLLAIAGGALASSGRRAVVAARTALRLPTPSSTAAVPAQAQVDVPGMTPFITPNADFYRIDIAFRLPELDPGNWSLRIHGLVEQELTIGWDELVGLPMAESVTTLSCVSNEVGGTLVGNAVWLGTPIRSLLERARPQAGADMLLSKAPDGFTAGTPLDVLRDPGRNAILAIGMNGEPLPLEHGYPVRMVVPGLYGYVSGTKWVTDWEVTRFADATAYWTRLGWSERGPVKLASRIDVPRAGASVAAGAVAVAGVAWHPHTALSGVQVQVDQGEWTAAELAPGVGVDSWREWVWRWDAKPGNHVLRVRALDADGTPQTEVRAAPAPDGASGLHEITVHVG